MEYTENENIDVRRFNPDFHYGLSTQQVQERLSQNLNNKVDDFNERTTKDIIKENVFTYFNLIFTVMTVLVVISGSFKNLTFLPVIIINTLIGIIQEMRAKKVLSKMKMVNQLKTKVVRNGYEQEIYSDDLVLDDIVILSSGNQIAADAIVLDGELRVNESLITGESDEIKKVAGDSLLSGSFVVNGECYAKLEKVGDDSYIAKLSKEAKKQDTHEQSEMIKSLNRLLKVIGIILIPIGIILFIQGFFINKTGFQKTIITMAAAILGMIPEGLYLLTTMALALSSMKLAKQNVLLHDMKSIETLSRVDTLCVDKTGTITEPRMEVNECIRVDSSHNIELLIGNFVANMNSDNETMKAMKNYFKQSDDTQCLSKVNFSSKYKYSSVTFPYGTFVLGAPEFILKGIYDIYANEINEYAGQGYRVLVFGQYNGTLDGESELVHSTDPLAFIILSNPVRKNAKKTFHYFEKQGVQIKVISGDNPVTVSHIAQEAGIKGYENYVDASTLRNNNDIKNAIENYTVFGRVTPNQKKAFVEALKKNGHTVAMTGDGVNDILALKKADCSIAMASGSDAATQAAQLVLLDSDFGHMPSVVLEGRNVVNNIQRSASLFLVKNIFSFVMSILTIIFAVTYPLEPSHISLISMFTIGIPGWFLALEVNNSRIEGKFLLRVLVKALPAAMANVFAVSVLIVCREVFGLPADDVSTASTLLLAIVGFMILIDISRPLNKYRITVIVINIIGLIICSTFFGNLFDIKEMSKVTVVLFISLSFAAESFFRSLTKLFQFLNRVEIRIKKD